jgi:hypothetical protein
MAHIETLLLVENEPVTVGGMTYLLAKTGVHQHAHGSRKRTATVLIDRHADAVPPDGAHAATDAPSDGAAAQDMIHEGSPVLETLPTEIDGAETHAQITDE